MHHGGNSVPRHRAGSESLRLGCVQTGGHIPFNSGTLPPLEHHQNITSASLISSFFLSVSEQSGDIYVLVEPECDLYAWSAVSLAVSWRE